MIHILSMKQLESLDAYRTAQDLAAQAYRLTQITPLTKHFALIDQIRRACLSVPANIAEGYAAPISPRHCKTARPRGCSRNRQYYCTRRAGNRNPDRSSPKAR